VEENLPPPLNTKAEGEEYRIIYPAGTADSVYYLSVFRDEEERLNCHMFRVSAVGTSIQSDPVLIDSDVDSTLRQTFQLITSFQSDEHYRTATEFRDIKMKVLPLQSTSAEITQLINELKAQLAIDLL